LHGDLLLQAVGGDVGLTADVRAADLLAKAEEVQVATFGQLAGQLAPAYPADQQAFEVVVVATFTGAA
jgi:hypothetical protein